MGTASDLDTLLEALDRADTAVRALYRQLANNPGQTCTASTASRMPVLRGKTALL
jgi:hypothetical protein